MVKKDKDLEKTIVKEIEDTKNIIFQGKLIEYFNVKGNNILRKLRSENKHEIIKLRSVCKF